MSDPRAGVLEPPELLEALSAAGRRLEDAAALAGLQASVPSCPDWVVRDLLRHTTGVHRWATRHVAEQIAEPIPGSDDLEAFVGGWPPDEALLGYFHGGLAALLDALTAAQDDLACFAFLPAPSPRWFWSRRQAHETAMHAIDAEQAAGIAREIEPSFAADGLDELLRGFVPRMRRRYAASPPECLELCCTDSGHRFVTLVGDAGATTDWAAPGESLPAAQSAAPSGPGARSVTVRGPASALYRWGWARAGRDELEIEGDEGVLDHFDQAVHVNW